MFWLLTGFFLTFTVGWLFGLVTGYALRTGQEQPAGVRYTLTSSDTEIKPAPYRAATFFKN